MTKTSQAKDTVRLCLVGDVMLGRRISAALDADLAFNPWGDTLALLSSCDAVIANLETPITSHSGRWSDGVKAFRFAASPRAAAELARANVRAVNLANNHILDCEARGLEDTLDHLGAFGIRHCGAGPNLRAAWRPARFRAGHLRVSMIGLTDNMREFAAGPETPGASYMKICCEPSQLAFLDNLIQCERKQGADVVILSLHWGIKLAPAPSLRFQAFARRLVSLGADIVHGHSAHLLHGAESYEDGLILYDTGDFLDDYWIFPGFRTDHGGAFIVDFLDGRPCALTFHPIKQRRLVTQLANGRAAAQILGKMERMSAAFGMTFERRERVMVARLAGGMKREDSAPVRHGGELVDATPAVIRTRRREALSRSRTTEACDDVQPAPSSAY